MKKFVICLACLFMLAGFAEGQRTKQTKGYFCGFGEGDGGFLFIRIGNVTKVFSTYTDEPRVLYKVSTNGTRIKNPYNIPIGTELIVKFVVKRKFQSPESLMREVVSTGKMNSDTKPCETR